MCGRGSAQMHSAGGQESLLLASDLVVLESRLSSFSFLMELDLASS
jgi:hypothetical protein